nr:hypothetical protein CFP56_39393 [Quercus suber]
MIENLKIFVTNEALNAFFLGFLLDLFGLSFNLFVQRDNFFDQRLSLWLVEQLYNLGFGRRRLLDEPFNGHINPCETCIFGLDHVFRDLETGGDWFEAEDNMHCSKFAVPM